MTKSCLYSFHGHPFNWRRWLQQFNLYMNATGRDGKHEKIQYSTFLTIAGEDALEIYNTFTFEEAEANKVKPLIKKFEAYCNPRKNVTYERHKFNTRCQEPDEKIDRYVTELRKLAKSCEFSELTDSLIRDRIVCGILDGKVGEKLLSEEDVTLTKAINLCRSAEMSKVQSQSLGPVEQPLHAIQSQRNYSKQPNQRQPSNQPSNKPCYRCGKIHEFRKCPAFGQTCRKCHRENHFASVCQAKRNDIHSVEQQHESDGSEELFVGTISTERQQSEWRITLDIEQRSISLKIDTGAQCNVMPEKIYRTISKAQPSKAGSKLVSYSGHTIKVVGKAVLLITYKGKYYPIEFQITNQDMDSLPVLGLATCLELNLVQRVYTLTSSKPDVNMSRNPANRPESTDSAEATITAKTDEIMAMYEDVFKGLGCLSGEYSIKIDPTVPPVIHPPRKVPFALRDKFEMELKRMEQLDVIEKVTEPTEWVNSYVITEKSNGKLRVCLDPRDLNKAIKREHYPMKTIEEVATKLSGAKYFSTLDASAGFWHIKLDDNSSNLTTF
ncbi:hypothetical protein QZH41_019256 [Actinostola sp. cb2023]|nr:hypothetical protein QZH41_019256 [Actinostola sp. cb2023]